MEHFEKRWVKIGGGSMFKDKGNFTIVTNAYDGKRWCVAAVNGGFPGDEDGLLTAQRICDYHNLVVPALRALVKDLENFGYVDFTEMTDTQTYELVQKAIDAIGRIGE